MTKQSNWYALAVAWAFCVAGPGLLTGCSVETTVAGAETDAASQQQALTADLPFRIQAEDFSAFQDSTSAHSGNCGSGAVDQETTTDPNGGGCNVGWTTAGEWLEYTFSSSVARNVDLVTRVASGATGKTVRLSLDGVNVGGALTAPNGGWQAFADRSVTNVAISAGSHKLRVTFETGDVNLNYIDVTPTRAAIPARIEAENYQRASESTPAANAGNACNRGDGVDKETTSDNAGGCSVGWTTAGEWLEYDLNLAQAQTLDFVARVASGSANKTFHLVLDGQTIGVTQTAPSAGWQAFQDRLVAGIPVSAGQHTLRVVFDSGDVNLNYVDVRSVAQPVKVRKGLVVLADFQNQRIEDFTGTGIRSEADARNAVEKVRSHWSWLSHGTEDYQWDLVRITLPVSYSATAYPDWGTFRNAAVNLTRAKIDASKYDSNSDGVIDAIWVIPATKTETPDYAGGGASENEGAHIFVDVQGSNSLQVGAFANFTHELGHCMNLPDLYGDFTTINYLSIMHQSWAVPGQDFTAWERQRLGWSQPRVVSQSTTGIVLRNSNVSFDSVKVPGLTSDEYFLIEYSDRPDTGYGSAGSIDHNGLAVYHVLEGSNQYQNPPLLKLEPADGSIVPNEEAQANDFFYPGHPLAGSPMILKSYVGGGEVFRIQNLSWVGSTLRFDVTVSGATPSGNLLPNGSVEQGTATPTGWTNSAWNSNSSFNWVSGVSTSGSRSISIVSNGQNDARWSQDLNNLVVGNTYVACGQLRGQNVVTGPDASVGANVFAGNGWSHSSSLSGSFDWTKGCVTFTADATTMPIGCRLGYFGSIVSGSIWCDDLAVYDVLKAFP